MGRFGTAASVMQAALNEKMAEFTASAKQFTMDGGIVYEFKDDEDYKTAKKDLSHLKKAMASNWVEQPRQRKTRINYNEAVRLSRPSRLPFLTLALCFTAI
jgi:hypothetical protein